MQYRAIVFKQLPASPDFSRSTPVYLPGRYAQAAAWDAVRAAMRTCPEIIGGEVIAENVAE